MKTEVRSPVFRLFEILRALSKATFVRGAAILAGGTALGSAIAVLASPVLTRLYTPKDMGQLGTFVAFVSYVTVATSLRYEVAIVSAKTLRDAAHLALASLSFIIPISLIATAALHFMRVNSILGFGILPGCTVFCVLPAISLTSSFYVLRYWFIREGNFGLISKVFVLQKAVLASSQIGLGFLGLGWMGLLGGELLGRAFGVGRMARLAWTSLADQVFPLKFQVLRQVLYTYRKFPQYSLPSSLIDILALQLVLPLVAQFYGADAAGQLALVQLVLRLPSALIGASVADSFHSRMATHAREAPHRTKSFFLQTAAGLFALGLGPAVLLAMFGPGLFQWVYGEDWLVAGLLAAVMAPWALAQFVLAPMSQVVFVFQGQDLKFIYDVISLLTVVGVLFLGHKWGLSVVENVGVLSVAQTLAYGIYFLLLWRIVTRQRRA